MSGLEQLRRFGLTAIAVVCLIQRQRLDVDADIICVRQQVGWFRPAATAGCCFKQRRRFGLGATVPCVHNILRRSRLTTGRVMRVFHTRSAMYGHLTYGNRTIAVSPLYCLELNHPLSFASSVLVLQR